MNLLVLFRFHGHFEICRERVRILKHLNPGVPVYALYGGPPGSYRAAVEALGGLVEHVYFATAANHRMHQDRTLRQWFIDVGRHAAFECLYDYEYDLLLTDAIGRILPAVDSHTVAFSGIKPFNEARPAWYWTAAVPYRDFIAPYLEYMRRAYGLREQSLVTQGPFPLVPRSFLEAIAAVPYPSAVFDPIVCEISFPGMAEALGFDVIDTGLHPKWSAQVPGIAASDWFHCEAFPLVTAARVAERFAGPEGRRAFHPVKELITLEDLLQIGAPSVPRG